MKLKNTFKFSTLVHAGLLLFIIHGLHFGCGHGKGESNTQSEEKKQGKKSPKGEKEEIKDKLPDKVEVEIVHIHVEKSEEQIAYEKAVKEHKECEPYFGGIGITWGAFGVIQKVFKYYPAWEAGLKENDVILNEEEIRGPIGTKIEIRYSRDGEHHSVMVTRGRICLKDNQ